MSAKKRPPGPTPGSSVANVVALQSMQALSALPLPTFPRSLLQDVPENAEVKLNDVQEATDMRRVPSPLRGHTERAVAISSKNRDWNSIQKAVVGLFQRKDPRTASGDLAALHENIRNLLQTKAGPFIFEYFKQQLLTRGMIILREDIKQLPEDEALQRLEQTWEYFYVSILPMLEAIAFPLHPKGGMTIRQTALVCFRDTVLLKVDVEGSLPKASKTSPTLKHMLLVLYNVNDSYPPNKNKLRLESMIAQVVVPFLGFRGLYDGGPDPVIQSSEPAIAARKRSGDGAAGRRISRPLSVQPQQLHTLNQLFINAIRKQQSSD